VREGRRVNSFIADTARRYDCRAETGEERGASDDDSHADPFDRMIAAQAIQNNLPVLSTDPNLDVFGVRRLKKPKR